MLWGPFQGKAFLGATDPYNSVLWFFAIKKSLYEKQPVVQRRVAFGSENYTELKKDYFYSSPFHSWAFEGPASIASPQTGQ